ncbi:MAG: hypothetical protein GY811_08485 [Myxococcales bacterium]|nr:hypothetical protein [Myxococcales bacterium]
MIRSAAKLALCALLFIGCGGDGASADPTGEYTIAITSGANGCGFENWQEGATSTGIRMTITEDDMGVTANVDGISALFLDLLQGSHVFAGDVTGSDLRLEIVGSREQNLAGCTHLVDSTLEAEIDGDILIGTISYTVADNTASECATFAGCASVQNFNGTRPPQ